MEILCASLVSNSSNFSYRSLVHILKTEDADTSLICHFWTLVFLLWYCFYPLEVATFPKKKGWSGLSRSGWSSLYDARVLTSTAENCEQANELHLTLW